MMRLLASIRFQQASAAPIVSTTWSRSGPTDAGLRLFMGQIRLRRRLRVRVHVPRPPIDVAASPPMTGAGRHPAGRLLNFVDLSREVRLHAFCVAKTLN